MTKMKIVGGVVCVLLIAVAFVCGYNVSGKDSIMEHNSDGEAQDVDGAVQTDDSIVDIFSAYNAHPPFLGQIEFGQVFFGTWELKEFLPYAHPWAYQKEEQDLRYGGDTITFGQYQIIYNGIEVTTIDPWERLYRVAVLPNDGDWYYDESSAPHYRSPTNKELGISGPFCVMFEILGPTNDGTYLAFDAFYVLDQNTMIGTMDGESFAIFKRTKWPSES